jgi:hypothetical protein
MDGFERKDYPPPEVEKGGLVGEPSRGSQGRSPTGTGSSGWFAAYQGSAVQTRDGAA